MSLSKKFYKELIYYWNWGIYYDGKYSLPTQKDTGIISVDVLSDMLESLYGDIIESTHTYGMTAYELSRLTSIEEYIFLRFNQDVYDYICGIYPHLVNFFNCFDGFKGCAKAFRDWSTDEVGFSKSKQWLKGREFFIEDILDFLEEFPKFGVYENEGYGTFTIAPKGFLNELKKNAPKVIAKEVIPPGE